MIIILNGITGSGKSTVGKALSKALTYNFIDLDKQIEKNNSEKIETMFQENGESYFREKESECLKEILLNTNNQKNLILSLGGGTFKNNANVDLCLSNGIVLWIDMSIDILLLRLKDITNRPLLKNSPDIKQTLTDMLKERTPNYEKSHIKVSFNKNYPTEYIKNELLAEINKYCIKNKLGVLNVAQ